MSDAPAITLRTACEADEAFLIAVYASTREQELARTDWPQSFKDQFCLQQGQAQHSHYRQHYPTARYFVILSGETPAGRLYVDHWEKEIRVMDIALLPDFRGKGIGTTLLLELQQQACSASKTLSIHVETFNPARRLYERLGFQPEESKDVYQLMRWTPR